MAFPDLLSYPQSYPGPYEQNMGVTITRLLRLFQGRVPDVESAARVAELAMAPDRWSAGHAVFDEVRRRALMAIKVRDSLRCNQYGFEELCCKSLYNATEPRDPFDPSSPFSVAGAAVRLAQAVGVPVEEVADVLAMDI